MASQEVIAKAADKLKETMAAPSCCPELKVVGQEWLDAVGTDRIADETKKLIQEVEEDILPIDDSIAFLESPAAIQILGEEGTKKMTALAKDVKAKGGSYCPCAACVAAVELLAMKNELLA